MLGLTAGFTLPLPPAQHNWSTHGLPIWMWCLELSDLFPWLKKEAAAGILIQSKTHWESLSPAGGGASPCPAMSPSQHWALLLWLSHTCSGKTQPSASYCFIKELMDFFARAAVKKKKTTKQNKTFWNRNELCWQGGRSILIYWLISLVAFSFFPVLIANSPPSSLLSNTTSLLKPFLFCIVWLADTGDNTTTQGHTLSLHPLCLAHDWLKWLQGWLRLDSGKLYVMIVGGSEHQELSGVEVKPINEWFSNQYKWPGAIQAHGRLLEIWKMLWSEEVVLTLLSIWRCTNLALIFSKRRSSEVTQHGEDWKIPPLSLHK